ncbi:HNH endonuclease [Mesobacillus harenae]|uniref:HNH endonuclease n=1 Tax=Mesobacillus harenae TaxID=2213203 RepID=UPI0015811E11|nr:HNH endonuclease signature motif containing protein [Mesobacillus harenae]
MAKKRLDGRCELCGREPVQTTVHHLIPKEMGGTFGTTADLCLPCHKQIHALFFNKELAENFHSITALQEEPRIRKYIRWIKKQPAAKLPILKKSNHKKRR